MLGVLSTIAVYAVSALVACLAILGIGFGIIYSLNFFYNKFKKSTWAGTLVISLFFGLAGIIYYNASDLYNHGIAPVLTNLQKLTR